MAGHVRGAILAVLPAFAAACSSPSTPSAPPALTGTVSDPAGDATSNVVPIAPDLVGATIQVAGGNLTLTISFAPGTYSQTQTLWSATLDTDENPATGSPGVDSGGGDAALLGADYVVYGVAPRGSTQAFVLRATGPNQFVNVGSVPVTFPAADQARVVVPLSMLGNDDGRLKFKIVCSQYLTDTTSTGITDYMPDLGLPPGVVR
jgi:hypothetical protein